MHLATITVLKIKPTVTSLKMYLITNITITIFPSAMITTLDVHHYHYHHFLQ